MPRVSLAFFSAAALCGLAGMVWGIQMSVGQDFTQMPAHAHLNLVGWASLALMGAFYALAGAPGRLPWINFALSTAGVAAMIPSLAFYLAGNAAAELGIQIGSILTVLGMALFVFVVLSRWARPAAA